tara:strand:- start:8 stop:814 length:807 start_codon:yes stop_codon:yes gene_type:complete
METEIEYKTEGEMHQASWVSPPIINKTNDYGKFSFVYFNRDINTTNLKGLIAENKKLFQMHLFPIIVDTDYKILDGQHRFIACKKNNWPVFFVTSEEDNKIDSYEQIRSVNSAGKKHSMRDRLLMLIKIGDATALLVEAACNSLDEKFDILVVLRILVNHGNHGSHLSRAISNRNLTMKEPDVYFTQSNGYRYLKRILKSDIINADSSKFTIAVYNLAFRFDLDPLTVLTKLEEADFIYRDNMNASVIAEKVVLILNKGKIKKNRIGL